ncbi:MAG: holo-[acyl-carrier-protein] synthase [bacterium]|nr:MAG: holo-[acyl-carrier-protein] synthase [bacterium]
MIAGLGVDLVEVERFRRICGRYGDRFLKKNFGESEIKESKRFVDPAPFLAARFAAKEAVSKALGTGFTGFGPKDVIVKRQKGEPPYLEFSQKLKTLFPAADAKDFMLSLSHEKQAAVAMVIWCRKSA